MNKLNNSSVLVDLIIIGEIIHQDLGQMQMKRLIENK